jgi:hypothetical protein
MSKATQPMAAPWLSWEIDEFVAVEPSGKPLPGNIVKVGDPFSLQVTFSGGGPWFIGLENLQVVKYEARFYAESIGNPGPAGQPNEHNLGSATGNLVPGQTTYPVTHSVTATLAEGLYRMGCVITFSPTIPGMVGFSDDLIVQIYL